MTLSQQLSHIARCIGLEDAALASIYRVAREGGSFGVRNKRGVNADLLGRDEIIILLRCVVISRLVSHATLFFAKFNQDPNAFLEIQKSESGEIDLILGHKRGGMMTRVEIGGDAISAALMCAKVLA